MKPPVWFTKALAVLDSNLRVRRSISSERWVIERKGFVPPTEIEILRRRSARLYSWLADQSKAKDLDKNKKLWKSVKDELDSAEAGYRVICTPNDLTPQVYNDLCQSDMQRYGGFARFCDEIEAAEAKAEIEADRVMTNRHIAFNNEVFDILSFMERKRAVSHQGKDLNYWLHGKKTQPGDGPLITLTDF